MLKSLQIVINPEENKQGLVIKINREFSLDKKVGKDLSGDGNIYTLLLFWVNSIYNLNNNNNKINNRIRITAFPPGDVFDPALDLVLSLVQPIQTSLLPWEEGKSGPSSCLRKDPAPSSLA